MRRALPALAAVLLLAGCGSSSSGGSSLPTLGTTTPPATTTPVVTPTTTTPVVDPSPWTALPKRDVGPNKGVYSGIVLASSVATSADERAAVDAYVAYWSYLAKVGFEVKIDKAATRQVATDQAAGSLESYVANLKKNKSRTVGWASMHVTKVFVGKSSVLVNACLDNGSFDVDMTTGRRLEKGAVAFDSQGAVQAVAGRPVVTFFSATDRSKPCVGV